MACFTCLSNFFCIFDVSGLVESLPNGLCRQSSWAYVRPANSRVNLSEEFLVFALGYAFEQQLDYAFFVQDPIH